MKANKFFIILILMLVSNIVFASGNGKVLLRIKPPKNEGGGALKRYRIEYRKFQEIRWEEIKERPEVKKINGKYVEQEYQVKELEEGEKYVFRVMAENVIGPGGPGPVSENVEARESDPLKIEVQSGEGLGGKSKSCFSYLSKTPIVNQGTLLIYRKED
ncbi:fibronectin type III domain-containing protein [uncultured Sanguibacteroides sp.]|uniref:fibronectin type III domain-containing protein n=1 Tax=uncultured Sanguibacteroides sp. TaxID=1635151 RepID=UPI0025EBFF92|nr:fibronectin type III domain-containing protein [uncultured Sanguibacteroides sp.]